MAAAAPAPSAKKRSRSEVVLKGRKSLKANLQKSQDIPATILEFQHAHDLGSAKCDALTELLRLTGMSRADVHKQLLESLTNELTDRIPTLSKPRQDDLLRKTFQFLERDVKELKMVPLALLKRRSDIPATYLQKFAEQEKLWDTLGKLPVTVQQQVWEIEAGARIFEARVAPLLDAYSTKIGQKHLAHAGKSSFSIAKVPSERWRAKSKELKALVKVVGPRRGLLNATCRMLMRRFSAPAAEGRQRGVWASLLGDLLLTYEIQTSVGKPPNLANRLKLAKVLDQAVRNGVLGKTSVAALHKALRSILPAPSASAAAGSGAVAGAAAIPAAAPAAAADRRAASDRLEAALAGAWAKLSALDVDRVFAQPVTDQMAPGYSGIIEHPMDLSLMRAKIGKQRGGYASFGDFCDDVDLMVQNCWKYNQKKSPHGQYATKLKGQWEKVRDAFQRQAAAPSRAAPKAPPPPVTRDGEVPLQAQDAGRGIEVGAAFMMLAQPAVFALLVHSLAKAVDDCLRERRLPASSPLVPILLQLLQMSHGARDMVALQTYAVPQADLHSLRLHLPLVARFLGETETAARTATQGSPSAAELLLSSKAQGWRSAFAVPAVRAVLQALCGASFFAAASQQQPSDQVARAAGMLRLLARFADEAMAKDSPFIEALQAASSKPNLRPQLRDATRELFAAFVERGADVPELASHLTSKPSAAAKAKESALPL
jgi:hypothetical protein